MELRAQTLVIVIDFFSRQKVDCDAIAVQHGLVAWVVAHACRDGTKGLPAHSDHTDKQNAADCETGGGRSA